MPINYVKEHKRPLVIKTFIVLTLLLVLFKPVIAFAEPIINEQNIEPEEKPGILEKHLSKFVLNTANSLISIMKAQDVSVLVFQREEVIDESNTTFKNSANATRDKMVFGLFPNGLFDGMARIYDVFNRLIPIPIFVLITLGGLFMMFDMIRSPENKSRAKEMILGLIIAILLIRFGHLAWEWIIMINYFIVDAVYVALKAGGIQVTSFISTVWDPSTTDEVMKSPSFVTALLVVFALFMTFMLNYQYMMRMIILAMLVVLFPVVLISSVIPSRRTVLNSWFNQFVSQVFIQSAHAVALGLFFFSLNKAAGLSFWFVLTMFFALSGMADVVQRIVSGFTGEGGGGGLGKSISNGSGMSGLFAVGAMTRGIFQNKGVSSKGKIESDSFVKGGNSISGISSDSKLTTGNSTQGNEGIGSVAVTNGLTDSLGSNGAVGWANNDGLINGNDNLLTASSNAPMTSSNGMTSAFSSVNSRPRGKARFGNLITNKGKEIATHSQLGKATKVATVGFAALGSIASTMVTGDGTKGAMIGASTGVVGTKVTEGMKLKGGKGLELIGEVIQSKAQGQKVMKLTRERLGFNDKTQLSEPSETKRMGQELLGGKLGSSVGSTVGTMKYYGDKLRKKHFEGAEENYNTVNEKRDLDWSIGQKEQEVRALKEKQGTARKDLEYSVAQYGTQHPETEAARSYYHQANLGYLKGDKELRDLRQKQTSFYAAKNNERNNPNKPNNNREMPTQEQEQRNQANPNTIKKHAQETRELKNHVRSSGQP